MECGADAAQGGAEVVHDGRSAHMRSSKTERLCCTSTLLLRLGREEGKRGVLGKEVGVLEIISCGKCDDEHCSETHY